MGKITDEYYSAGDISQDLADVKSVFENAIVCRQYDSDMQKAVEWYKKQMLDWFAQSSFSVENALTSATQEQWYNLYLEKKRLEQHRLYLQYMDYRQVPRNSEERALKTLYTYNQDGKYLVCKAKQNTYFEKCYWRDNRVISRYSRFEEMSYYIMRSQNAAGMYICPNCGAEMPLEALLDGCDYCGSKFDVSAYQDKVTAVCINDGIYGSREVNGATVVLVVITAVLLMIGIMFPPIWGKASWIMKGVFLLAAVCSLCGTYISNGKTIRTTKMKRKIKANNPDFSVESFLASLDCKIKAIHFARKYEDIAPFVKCDMTPYLQNYQNVVSCDTGRYALKKYWTQGEDQFIEFHREVSLQYDCGDRFHFGNEIISMTLAKKRSHKLKNDVTMYRCGGCGSTVSLLEGGKCAYCGKEMNLIEYDWIVVEYGTIPKL